ncbi:MAG: hypothetical protein LBO03_04610 [Acidaminococcales bacterium]|nr:hypothetical protein [Acidaminococcales bacterium]
MKKKILLCFGESFSGQRAFEDFSARAVTAGFEVHSFGDALGKGLMPHSLLGLLQQVWQDGADENDYFFLADNRDFFKLCYRVFQQTFRHFVFWAGAGADDYAAGLEGVYLALLGEPAKAEENLRKPIFVSDLNAVGGDDFYGARLEGIEGFFAAQEPENSRPRQNIYRHGQECYLLEPMIAGANYIDLDGQAVDAQTKFSDIVTPVELDKKLLKQAEDILELIFRNAERVMRRREVGHKLFSMLQADMLTGGAVRQKYCAALVAVMGEGYGLYAQIYALSFLLQSRKTGAVYKYLLEVCLASDQLTAQNKYYILCQNRQIQIIDRAESEGDIFSLEAEVLAGVSAELEKLSCGELRELAKIEADPDCVLVLVGQFLNYAHPLSKFSLELCRFLIASLKKNVCLLNTCEFLTTSGSLLYFDPSHGVIMTKYANDNRINYEETIIPYGQMIMPMPNTAGIDGIAELAEHLKPSLILNLSDLSVAADILGRYIKTVCVPLRGEYLPLPAGGRICLDADALSDGQAALYRRRGAEIINLGETLTPENINQEEILRKIFVLSQGKF